MDLYFNPRSREGSDGSYLIDNVCYEDFNPRSREGSDFVAARTNQTDPRFQSALPRGERPGLLLPGSLGNFISIRAPARGATLLHHAWDQ